MSNTAPKATKPSPAEAAQVDAGIVDDPYVFEWDEQWFVETKPPIEVQPTLLEQVQRTRGKQKAPRKQDIHIRLDRDVIDHFKRDGRGWQTRINDTLRKIVEIERANAEQGS
jgi:uncharacterized protein (DUF4415 family)